MSHLLLPMQEQSEAPRQARVIRILLGDVFAALAKIPDNSVDCVVTSPPYWGLRDYGVDGQLGLERSLGEHIDVMVRVFREIRRVLKPTGTCFLNYGDCYATAPNGRSAADTKAKGSDDRTFRDKPFSTFGPIYGVQDELGCGSAGKVGSGSQGRGLSSQNHDDERKGSRSKRTSDSDARLALEQAAEPLKQILANMALLLAHLPNADCADLKELQRFSAGVLDPARDLIPLLASADAALASTTPESSEQHPEDYRLSCMLSACLSSLRSCVRGVQPFADMSAEFSEMLRCKSGNALPFEELAQHIECTAACCSLLASSWRHIEPQRSVGPVLKPKDLCMIPNRLAIALQEDGWWVRSEIIWHKSNPMPESIKDRPGSSHEKVFLLSKSERYYYDHIAVRQPLASASVARLAQNVDAQEGSARAHAGGKTNGRMKAVVYRAKDDEASARNPNSRPHSLGKFEAEKGRNYPDANLRNVWTIPTAAFSDAHFATFPPELVERCLKAGCPVGGLVLDPFGGSGTTALVADGLGMDCTLIELNPAYVEIARKRLSDMFRTIDVEAVA